MTWENTKRRDINHEKLKTICKVKASKAACNREKKIKDVIIWTSRITQQFWKCFLSQRFYTVSLCIWLNIFYFLQRTNQPQVKMMSLPQRIPCSYQVRGKTKVLWSNYPASWLDSCIYFNIYYQTPKQSSDINIVFLTVKTNAISVPHWHNSWTMLKFDMHIKSMHKLLLKLFYNIQKVI